MKKIAHLVKNPCNPDWRVIKAANAGLSENTAVKIFASAKPNVSQQEIFDGVEIYRCYPRFEYHSSAEDRNTVTRANLFFDSPSIISYYLDLLINKISRNRFPVSPRVIAHQRISRYIKKIYMNDILEFAPDIIHAHDLETLDAALTVKKKINCKVIFDSHEYEVEKNPPAGFFSKLTLHAFEKRMIKKADLVITVSDEIAHELKQGYSLNEIPSVIYNVPSQRQFESAGEEDLVFYDPEKSLSDLMSYQYCGIYIGLLTINRGIEDSLRALSMLHNHALILAGPRNNITFFNSLLKLIAKLQLEDRVFIVDNISKGLIGFISIADYSLVTTLPVCKSSEYSMPNKLFESIAAEVPIICSNTISAPRFVTEHNLGLVYLASNHFDLARVINEVIQSKELCQPFIASDSLKDELSEKNQYKSLREYYLS